MTRIIVGNITNKNNATYIIGGNAAASAGESQGTSFQSISWISITQDITVPKRTLDATTSHLALRNSFSPHENIKNDAVGTNHTTIQNAISLSFPNDAIEGKTESITTRLAMTKSEDNPKKGLSFPLYLMLRHVSKSELDISCFNSAGSFLRRRSQSTTAITPCLSDVFRLCSGQSTQENVLTGIPRSNEIAYS